MINIVAFMGPSGSGKTTLAKYMNLRKVTTFTTREIRKGERDGVDYFFLSDKEFSRLYEEGDLLERTEYGGYFYGTGIEPLRAAISNGDVVSIVIDFNGARRLREVFPDNLLIVGISSPLQECVDRMLERGEPDIERRSQSHGDEIKGVIEISDLIINNSKDNWWKSRLIIEALGKSLMEKTLGENHSANDAG
ncbi:MAG: guanylate kinase [Gudongella sp.]|nr:guanylate kinase [Gudongella sp.]